MAAYVVRKLPFGVTLMQSSLKQIPQVYEEAAIMCGAGSYALFRRIMFPLYRSILGSILIITFLSSLFEVSASLLLPMEEKYFPIAKALYALQSRPDGLSLAAAYAVLVMLMTMLGFLITARWQNRSIASLIRGSA
jgi:ABC-type Fe3+ transport system permease subunit